VSSTSCSPVAAEGPIDARATASARFDSETNLSRGRVRVVRVIVASVSGVLQWAIDGIRRRHHCIA
jgi:hypothetical protein